MTLIPSPLFAILLALGGLPLLFSLAEASLVFVAAAYNAALVALFLVDLKITARPEMITVRRRCEDKLSLGGANSVQVSRSGSYTHRSYK